MPEKNSAITAVCKLLLIRMLRRLIALELLSLPIRRQLSLPHKRIRQKENRNMPGEYKNALIADAQFLIR